MFISKTLIAIFSKKIVETNFFLIKSLQQKHQIIMLLVKIPRPHRMF